MTLPDYRVRWQVDFAARNNTKFRVEVLEEDYYGTISHLQGAEVPFETEEDATEDPLMPIRKQTGTLRILDDGKDLDGNDFDYKDIFPSDSLQFQVRLWQVGSTETLRWIGYVLDGTLTASLFEKVPVREYQLTCPLGLLYNLPLTFSNNQTNKGTVPTFGAFLHKALRELYIDWQHVIKQNNVPGRGDLTSRVSLLNFCDANEPKITGSGETYTATWTDKSTYGDALQEICLYWGWTLMTRGLDIYIMTRGQNRPYTTFDFYDLTDIDTTLQENNIILVDGNVDYIDTGELTYMSTDHNECTINGKKNITVNADVNAKDTVIKPDLRKLDYEFLEATPGEPIHISGNSRYVKLATTQASGSWFNLDNYRMLINKTIMTGVQKNIVVMDDTWKYNEDKASFNLKEGIQIWQGNNNSSNNLIFSAETAEDIIIPSDSMISIVASARPNADPSSSDTFPESGLVVNLGMRIGGNKWYIGTVGLWDSDTKKHPYNGSWSDSIGVFQAVLNSGGNIELSRGELAPYNGSSGYCIYVGKGDIIEDGGACGRLKFFVRALAGSQTSDALFKAEMMNFKIGIYVHDDVIQPECKDSQTFTDVASNDFREDLDVSLAMVSGDKNKYGLGQVVDVNFNQLTGIPYINGNGEWDTMLPEERLLARMVAIYSSVTQECTIEVEDNLDASLPDKRFEVNWRNNEVFTLLACSHNWREATMKLTLINK